MTRRSFAGMGGRRTAHGGCALGVMLAETQRRSCRSRKSVFLSSDGASLGGYPRPAPQIEIKGSVGADGSQKVPRACLNKPARRSHQRASMSLSSRRAPTPSTLLPITAAETQTPKEVRYNETYDQPWLLGCCNGSCSCIRI